jgi:hypothetical protein
MDVDEPAAVGPSTPKKSIPPSTPPRGSIPETAVQQLGSVLELILQSTLDSKVVLPHVWFAVNGVLSQDETMNTRLVDQVQFLKNVDKIGVESFINLLRDIQRMKSWRDLLENGTYCLHLISSTLIVPCFQTYF